MIRWFLLVVRVFKDEDDEDDDDDEELESTG